MLEYATSLEPTAVFSQPLLFLFQFCSELLLRRSPLDFKDAISGFATVVAKTKKVELVWFTTFSLSICFCKSTEREQFRLARFYCKIKFAQSRAQFPIKTFCIAPVLKACQEIVSVSEEICFSSTLTSKAADEPEVKNIMKIYVREQW
jgi:hypothetical protein